MLRHLKRLPGCRGTIAPVARRKPLEWQALLGQLPPGGPIADVAHYAEVFLSNMRQHKQMRRADRQMLAYVLSSAGRAGAVS